LKRAFALNVSYARFKNIFWFFLAPGNDPLHGLLAAIALFFAQSLPQSVLPQQRIPNFLKELPIEIHVDRQSATTSTLEVWISR